MMTLAQIPEPVWPALAQGGILGIIIGLLLWRDSHRDVRDAERDKSRDDRDVRRDEKLDKLASSINHLTRAMTLEVLTRPTVAERAKEEARELQEAIGQK